jgi:S1-C subfamily serine protease
MRRTIIIAALLLTDALSAHAADSPQQFLNEQVSAKSRASLSSNSPNRRLARESGARVEEVIPNTAAARAGMQPGDIITGIGGREIGGFPDLDSIVAANCGRSLAIDIDRSGTHLRLKPSPSLALVQSPYYSVQQRWALGISHTEFRFISCAVDPDCE